MEVKRVLVVEMEIDIEVEVVGLVLMEAAFSIVMTDFNAAEMVA